VSQSIDDLDAVPCLEFERECLDLPMFSAGLARSAGFLINAIAKVLYCESSGDHVEKCKVRGATEDVLI
jgi:hypothetical protein